MISFKAHKISNVNILKKQENNCFKDYVASFAEFNPHNIDDKETIKDTVDSWGKSLGVAQGIKRDVQRENVRDFKWWEFYGMVDQGDSFEKVKFENVLGLMEVRPLHDRLCELNLLQVHPEHNFFSFTREFKLIGTGLLDALKNQFPKMDILTEPLRSLPIIQFYESNGFIDIGDGWFKYIARK